MTGHSVVTQPAMPAIHLRQDIVKTIQYVGSKNSQCIYWDETLPGFGVRVFPNGRRSYVVAYRINGRKRIKTVGRADVLTLDQARKNARVSLVHVIEGKDPKEAEDALRASPTVKVLCGEYIERHAKPKKRTWKADDSLLTRCVIPKLGARLAASITTDDISRLHVEFGETAPYSANRVLETIRKMFNLAKQWRCVPLAMQNPAVGIQKFPEVKRRRYVTVEEMPRLAKAIETEPNEFVRHAIWLLLLTGLRCGEMLRAKWADIDWHNRTLYVGQTKNGDPVLAPLSRAAIARLKTIPRVVDNPYIIVGLEKGQHLVNLTKPWGRIREDAGLLDLRLHDLRRTVGSWLVRSGASLHLVGAVLNHRDQKTTAGYAYFQTQDRTAALDKHGAFITRTGGIRPSRQRSNSRRYVSFEREELYKMVWEHPISQLAAKFGISDVGLSKACKRANIPTPNRGYWAKVANGLPADRLPLPVGEVKDLRVTISKRFRRAGRIVSLAA